MASSSSVISVHAFSEGGFWTVAHEQRTLLCYSSCYTGRSGHRNSRIKAEEGDLRQGLGPGRGFLLRNVNGDFLNVVSFSTPSSLRRKAEECLGAGGPGIRTVTEGQRGTAKVRPWPASSPFGVTRESSGHHPALSPGALSSPRPHCQAAVSSAGFIMPTASKWELLEMPFCSQC